MRILVIDDAADRRATIADVLRDAGHDVIEAGEDAGTVESLVERGEFDLAISDIRMPEIDGLTLLRKARKVTPSSDFILMTAFAEVGDAVAALKEGAIDYLTKPFDIDDLLHQISHIESDRSMRRELGQARHTLARHPSRSRLVGESQEMLRVRARIETIARSEASVLVYGESGTGKELVAQLLHERSPRAEGPFITVNCGAFPETLIEAELFGYERGAFTGATKKRDGRFKAADGGTLFLDEIAELPLSAQAKLLRVLQESSFEPLGTNAKVKVDVHLVCATHRDLRERIAAGLFREDLFYRINVLDVTLPPLRERQGDIPILIQLFLDGFSRRDPSDEVRGASISVDAYAALSSYSYPGNVRELAHAIQHAVVLAGGREIALEHLPAAIAGKVPMLWAQRSLPAAVPSQPLGPVRLAEAVREFEKTHVHRVLAAVGGKRTRAAEMLGISRKTLWEKLRAYHREQEAPEPSRA